MMSASILSNSNNVGVGVGNNNQRKSKRELELMKLRRAPICEVIVPPATSSSSSSSPLLVKSNQADNEETTAAVKSNNNDLLLQPVHSAANNSQGNQPDLVAQSHELSKRRFFEKLQRRESAMHQSACVRPVAVGTIFEQNHQRQVHLKEGGEEANEAQDSNEHHDDGQLRVLPLDGHDHAREIDCVRGEFPSGGGGGNNGANEQIPETIVHLVDEHLNALHRHKAHEHDATMSQKVAPPSSSPSSSGASSSSSSSSPPWLIENHGYASLAPALSTIRRRPPPPPASAVAYRQYANLPPMSNAPAWPRGSTTTSGASSASVPVGYATVRPSSTRIPQPATCAAENKKDLTSTTTTSGASEIDCDSDAAPRRPASNSSTSNHSSGGFSSARRFHPAAVRDLIDHNRFATGHQEHLIFANEAAATMMEPKSPGNQNGQRKKSSLLKRFGSLASKAFNNTTTSNSTAPASSQTNVGTNNSPAPSVYSQPKSLLVSSGVVGPTITRANFIAIKETADGEEAAADRQIVASIAPTGVMQMKEDATSQSQVNENILAAAAADFTPDLNCRPAPVIQSENGNNNNNKRKSHKLAALASADLVILPAKNSKNNKIINQSGNYNHHNYNRRASNAPQQQQRQHLSRDGGKSCAIAPISSGGGRRVRNLASECESSSSSSSASLSSLSSSLQSSLAYSSLISTASGDEPVDSRQRRGHHRHHHKHHKRPTEKTHTARRRACSLSDELESLMSPSEDTGEPPERQTTSAASPPSSGGRKGEANAPAAARAQAKSSADSTKSKSRASLLRNWFGHSTSNSSVLSLSPALRDALPDDDDDERHFSSHLMMDKSHAIISNSSKRTDAVKRNESTTRRQQHAKASNKLNDGPASMGAIYSSVQRRVAANVELIDEPQPKMNICTSLLRNYVSRRHHHHHHHHHSHSHSRRNHNHNHNHQHHSSHNHHKRSQRSRRHAHCVSLPPVTSNSSAPAATTSCSSCCSSLANDGNSAKSKATVWGQLIKINKSDGSQVVELQRAPSSSWGFFVARGAINSVKGIFISRMHDSATSNSLAGLLSIGDRILSIDNCPIQEPEFDLLRVNQMISKKSKISLKVKPFKG